MIYLMGQVLGARSLHFWVIWVDRQKVMHKSPSCISTGGLKNDKDV